MLKQFYDGLIKHKSDWIGGTIYDYNNLMQTETTKIKNLLIEEQERGLYFFRVIGVKFNRSFEIGRETLEELSTKHCKFTIQHCPPFDIEKRR